MVLFWTPEALAWAVSVFWLQRGWVGPEAWGWSWGPILRPLCNCEQKTSLGRQFFCEV